MTALNEEVLPIVWSLARRELLVRPRPTFDEVVDRLTPTGLLKREKAEREARRPASRHVRPSLTALVNSGAVVRDGDRLQLLDPGEDEQAFRLRVLRGVLHTEKVFDDEGVGLAHQAEAAFAWLHLQGLEDPVAGSWNDAQAALQAHVRGNATDWLNDVAFNTLERWARWFGWVRRARHAQVDVLWPDPTPLVRALLPEVLGQEALPAREFAEQVAERLPWLPNGSVGREVAAVFADVPDRSVEQGRVPEGLSLTLQRLHLEQALRLVPGDDARASPCCSRRSGVRRRRTSRWLQLECHHRHHRAVAGMLGARSGPGRRRCRRAGGRTPAGRPPPAGTTGAAGAPERGTVTPPGEGETSTRTTCSTTC